MKSFVALLALVVATQPLIAQGRFRMNVNPRDDRQTGQQSADARNRLTPAERQALQAQVFQSFMERASERLGLDAGGRVKLAAGQHLADIGAGRNVVHGLALEIARFSGMGHR